MIKICLSYTKTGTCYKLMIIIFKQNWYSLNCFVKTGYLIYTNFYSSTLTSDEARHQLQEIGQFHLGDMVNVFRHGSLVMQHFTDTYVSVQGGILYGTCSGALGNFTVNYHYNSSKISFYR